VAEFDDVVKGIFVICWKNQKLSKKIDFLFETETYGK